MVSDHTIDQLGPYPYPPLMGARFRKVTVNIPAGTLEAAVRVTGKGITPTIVEGLQEIERRAKRSALRALRGKIRFDLDVEATRR